MKRRAPAPVATLALVAVVFFAYAAEQAGDGMGVCNRWGLVPAHPTVVGTLGSMVLHDPSSWWHVVGNSAALLVAGSIVERALGHTRLLVLFVVAGVVGAMTHVAVDPTSLTPLVGSSGAICGLFAAAALLRPSTVSFVATFIAYNIACLLLGAGGAVSVACHVGGFSAGALMMGTIFARRLAEVRGWRAPRMARGAAPA